MDGKQEIKGFIKKVGLVRLILLLICGVFLIIVSLPQTEEKNQEGEKESQITFLSNENDQYIEKMEMRLEEILARIKGTGKVDVMITLASSSENVVHKDQTYEQSLEKEKGQNEKEGEKILRKEETVFTEQSGKQQPYILKTMEPLIEGIVIVMDGGNDPSGVTSVTQAVLALFPVEEHKIGVLKREDGQ